MSSKSSKKSDGQLADRLIVLGRLVNTHGVRGELRLLPYGTPSNTLRQGLVVFLQQEQRPPREYVIERVRPRPPFVLVKLQGIDSLEQAQALRGWQLAVTEASLPPLQEGEFYYYQVIGLTVYTTSGDEVGTVTQVFFSGSHEVWVVQQEDKEHMIPVTEEIVRHLDLVTKRAVIEPIAGLLE